MKRLPWLCFLPLLLVAAGAQTTPDASVVRVFAEQRRPDVRRPWQKAATREVTGSGVVIEGHRILTSAHVVEYAGQIQVQANESGDRISAKVLAVSYGMDLALLSLDDASFFASHPALARRAVLPQIKDAVVVCGFPVGGTTMSTTKGIVSRIEFVPYHYSESGLRLQLDAAINAGDSGGPALMDNRMIGLAVARLANAQNIGYVVPDEEIELFLGAVARGGSVAKPALYDEFEPLQNPTLRKFLRLDPSVHGLVVRRPFPGGKDSALREWDVVTRIGSTPIDDQGEIPLNDSVRVRFQYLVQKLTQKGAVPLTVIRRGQTLRLAVPVAYDRPRVVPSLEGRYPSYFIYGPMSFTNATDDYFAVSGTRQIRGVMEMMSIVIMSESGNPLLLRRADPPAFPGEQLVVMPGPFLPHPLILGYPSPAGNVVDTVNGVHVRNLAHLVQLLRDCKDEYVTIAFAGRTGQTVVLPRAETVAATDGILGDNDIRSQGSPDMMAIWQAAPAR